MNDQLTKAANYFACNPGDTEARLKLHELVNDCNSIDQLHELIGLDFENIDIIILMRIEDLLNGSDYEIYLALANWLYHFGEDDQAFQYLEKAKRIQPISEKLLGLEVWMNYNTQPDLIRDLCKNMLQYYPNNKWANNLRKKLEENGFLDEMDSPEIKLKWN